MKPARQLDRPSATLRFRAVLEGEFRRRERRNPRYSLRAFARSVNIEHSTLSQLIRGRRAVTWKSIRRIAGRMNWPGGAILALSAEPGFRFDSRVLARKLGITVDEVNIVLTDLCMFGLMELKGE